MLTVWLILHADSGLNEIFPGKSAITVYKRPKHFKKILAPSSYSKAVNSQVDIIILYNSYDICKKYLVADLTPTSRVS